MLSYKRLVEALNEHAPNLAVAEAMLSDLTPAAPHEELFDVQQRLKTSELDALPVMAGSHFLGLITVQDISEVYRLLSIDPDLLPEKQLERQIRTPYSPLVASGR
jgi:predicted transcriptional regulator